jgi:plastocyanin
MHTVALQLAPIMGAEKSKVPFYIAGGLLVAWALFVSLGLGMRRPDFPSSVAGQRGVMAITAVLVLAAASTAVLTAGTPAKSAVTTTTNTNLETAPLPGTPSASSTTPTQSTTTTQPTATTQKTSSTQPTATTGTPAPPSSPAAAGSSLSLAANSGGALSYNTKTLSAKAGTVTITMTNMSPLEHNVTVAEGAKVLGATPTFSGGSKTLTLKLKPGKYTFYCSVPGHRAAGMEGTLTVS